MSEPKVYRYKAFINYAHQDIAFARWLQKNIENYTIPSDIRNRYPNLPNDLRSSIFLDESILSSGETLSQTLQEGMDDAESMIVLCSPRALLSRRVEDKIKYFRYKHKERKIFTLLIDGKAENVIPQALRIQGEAPLLIDISQSKTRKKAFLKVIASLLGIDSDALWKIEVQKKRKKRLLKTVIAVLFLLISGYTYIKVFPATNKELEQIERQIDTLKKEREVQKGDAQVFNELSVSLKELEALKRLKEDSLKYFMLLKNAEAEEAYNEKGVDAALAILQSSTLDKKDASSAVKNMLLAKLYMEKGDLEKAEEYYVNAVEADDRYEYLLEYTTFLREQNATEKLESVYEKMRIYDLPKEEKAKVLENLAVLYTQEKKYKEAEDIYKEALILYEALAKKNPEKYDLNLAKIYKGLALYYTESGQSTKAQEMYVKALALWETLEKVHAGEYTLEVSNSLYMLGKFYSSSDVEKAQSYFESALKMQRKLYKENPERFSPALARTLGEVALLYKNNQQFDKAEMYYQEALVLERALYSEDPDVYLDQLQNTVNTLARMLSQLKKDEEARGLFEEADSYEKLRAKRVLLPSTKR